MPPINLRQRIRNWQDVEWNFKALSWLLTGRTDATNILDQGITSAKIKSVDALQITGHITEDHFPEGLNPQAILDGEGHGTFLDGRKIISPVIMGNAGYFADRIKVGQDGPIIIDGTNRRIDLLDNTGLVQVRLGMDGITSPAGKLLMGGSGVLSAFMFVSSGDTPGWNTNQGWGHCGLFGDTFDGFFKTRQGLRVYVPRQFKITSAELTLQAMPTYAEYLNESFEDEANWKQGKNLRLYEAESDDGFFWYKSHTSMSEVTWREGTNVTSSVLGVSSWNPTLEYAGGVPSNTANKVQRITGDIRRLLTPGGTTTFYLETTDLPSYSNYQENECLVQLVAIVEGYKLPD